MNDTELIAKQAREIEELKQRVADFERANDRVHMILFAIGAPLNDNLLGYTNKQLGPFGRIARELDLN